MGTQAQILLAAVFCGAVMTIVYSIKGRFLAPVRSRDGVRVISLIVLSGEAEGLEETLRGLEWLRDTGKAYTDEVIVPYGLSPDARYRTEKLARKSGAAVCALTDLAAELENRVLADSEPEDGKAE